MFFHCNGYPRSTHLGPGDHAPKTDRSRPRSVPVTGFRPAISFSSSTSAQLPMPVSALNTVLNLCTYNAHRKLTSISGDEMAAFCACCGTEITLKAEACPICGTPRHGMLPPELFSTFDIDPETPQENFPGPKITVSKRSEHTTHPSSKQRLTIADYPKRPNRHR